ncbi:MAG TPA: acyclic terpene utilization AtuA family protein [Salinivirgaceae bacterium]|nr:acyclic terpene utilization AtuA family protein [Salinivirgaceae bacterium]
MKELRILSPTAILGYGFPMESFVEGMKRKPHVIAVDAGSTDPGPYYLGAGKSFTDPNSVKRDLEIMIPAAIEAGIPLIVGTAGGSGARPHVNLTVDIVKEIAREKKLSFKMAVIQSEFDKEFVKENLRKGNITPLKPAPQITEADINESVHIVAQMGEEPFIEALENGADVILAGRSYDPSVFSALAIKNGFNKGLAIHLGKILECAAIAALPGSGSDCMFGYLHEDNFVLEPLSPLRKCTTLSVAAHTLYEKTNPYILPGPGGAINLHESKFEQIDDNKVRVSGSRFVPTEEYFVKLEGVKRVGYRTISCAGVKDPIMISKIDSVTDSVKDRVKNNFESYGIKDFFLDFKIYGRNGVMGMFPDAPHSKSDELLIIIEAVAATQEQADTICGFARSTMLHFGYEGRIATAGNLAFPFSPSDAKMGEVFEFNVYHLMKVKDPKTLFPIEYIKF